jgi:catechol 2,3-dioxygenase
MQETQESNMTTTSLKDAQPIFASRRLGHVNLIVDELQRSTDFYNQVCGLALEFSEVGLKANFLGTGHTPHDIGMIECTHGEDRYGRDGHLQIPGAAAANIALNHIAWEMPNEAELVAGYERARAAGLDITRTADHQIAHSIYMRDPDGNVVEFYSDTVKDWRNVLHGEVDLITSRWDPAQSNRSQVPLHDPNPEIRIVPEAPVHPRRLTHAVLATNDVGAMCDFYEKIGGLERIFKRENSVALLRGSHSGYRYHLAIVAAPDRKSGLHHFALELGDATALDAAAGELQRRGFAMERKVDGPLKQSLFLIDPDGFRVEFFTGKDADYAKLEKSDPKDLPFLI